MVPISEGQDPLGITLTGSSRLAAQLAPATTAIDGSSQPGLGYSEFFP